MSTRIVRKGTGRAEAKAKRDKHAQRTPLPGDPNWVPPAARYLRERQEQPER